jgi:hypothetical protein
MARRFTLLAVAALLAAACGDVTGPWLFGGTYHVVGLYAPADTAFTGSFRLAPNGANSVIAIATFAGSSEEWRGQGVVQGDTVALSVAPVGVADVGRGFTGMLTQLDIAGTWVAQGFTPQPPPHGTFTAHRS